MFFNNQFKIYISVKTFLYLAELKNIFTYELWCVIYCHTENATVELKLKLIIMGNLLGRGHTWPHELWCTLVLHRRGVVWTLCGPWGGLWTLWTNDPCGCQPAHSAFELKQLGNKSIILPVEQNYTRVSHNDIKMFTIRLNISGIAKAVPCLLMSDFKCMPGSV